jgi:hypothetical protein
MTYVLSETQKQQKNTRQRARYAADLVYRAGVLARAKAHNETPSGKAMQKERARKWIENNLDLHRERSKLSKRKQLGIPEPTRPAPSECECCGQQPKGSTKQLRVLRVDHDHTTGNFRGWLCNTCNLAIGKLGDNVAGLTRALNYLTRAEE